MARAKTSPAARLEALQRVKPRLRRFKRDETLTAKPMSELLGVTWPVLRGWCDEFNALEANGAYVRGGNGIEWVFRPRETVSGLIAEFKAEIEAGRAKASRLKRQVAGDQADRFHEDASLDDMRKQLDVTTRVRIEREAQRELVHVTPLRETLNRTFSDMRDAGLRTLQRMDPNGRWSGEERKFAQEIVTGVLVEQERAAHAAIGAIGKLNGGAA